MHITEGGDALRIAVDVVKDGDPIFPASDAVNRYDNEQPDINGDGLQVYVRIGDAKGAWVLVPDGESDAVRIRSIAGWSELADPRTSWRRTDRGYVVDVAIPLRDRIGTEAPQVDLDVIVNETRPDRERRRGQLVLSGAAGEFVYLTGDRHDPDRLLPFRLAT